MQVWIFVASSLTLSAAFAPSRRVLVPTRLWSSTKEDAPSAAAVWNEEEADLVQSFLAEETPTLDVGKELVLSNMNDAELSATVHEEFASIGVEAEPPVAPAVDEETTEAVSAILAASEEAVMAAEASLSDATVESVDQFVTEETLVKVPTTPDIIPASTAIEEARETIDTPSVHKILKFAIPAIGVWLCGPLLSLIDTSSVGILSGTIQQAALNPAVAVTDYAALLIAFLYTGTTNMVAAARETDRAVEGSPRTMKTLVGALQLSTYVGAALGTILFAFARPLLRAIIGNDAISPAVFAAAMKYVRIRALGMPAAAVIGSAQAACLGMQDIKSPLYVLAAAAIVNFCGDMLFVGSSHPLIGGAAGAAWATVFSQYAAVAFFLHWLCNKPKRDAPKVVNLSKAILELTGTPFSEGEGRRTKFRDSLKRKVTQPLTTAKSAKKDTEPSFSVRGFLQNRFRGRDLVKLPAKDVVDEFVPYMAPVTSTQVGRVSGYVAMSHVVASSLGTVSMAAQQVIVSLFYCLCPIADSLSLTAQSFIPAIAEKKPSRQRAAALKKTGLNFIKAGGVFGAIMVAAVSCIPFLAQFFTSDPVVMSQVGQIAPLLAGVFAVHGIVCATEGLLLGQKDLSFLGKMYAGYFVVVPYFMLRVKSAALSGARVGLTSVWKVFLGYQLFRSLAWVARVGLLQFRTDRRAAQLPE